MLNKDCNRCNIKKSVDEFYKDKRWLFWVRSICKECDSLWRIEWYQNNRDRLLEQHNNYAKTNKWLEVHRLCNARRRKETKKTCDKTINFDNAQSILIEQNYKCNYCSKDITEHKTRHLDHIIPVSKWWLHTIKNVQWLCIKCNLSKHNKIL